MLSRGSAFDERGKGRYRGCELSHHTYLPASVSFILFFSSNSFIEIEFIYETIHSLKVDSSVAFAVLRF